MCRLKGSLRGGNIVKLLRAIIVTVLLLVTNGVASAETWPVEWMPAVTHNEECQVEVCRPLFSQPSDEGKCFKGVAAPASNDKWLSQSFTLPAGSYHFGFHGANANVNPGGLALHKTFVKMASAPESGLRGGFQFFNDDNDINHWGQEGDIWLGDERAWTIYATSTGTWSFCFWPQGA